jgi:hypothetical protein
MKFVMINLTTVSISEYIFYGGDWAIVSEIYFSKKTVVKSITVESFKSGNGLIPTKISNFRKLKLEF